VLNRKGRSWEEDPHDRALVILRDHRGKTERRALLLDGELPGWDGKLPGWYEDKRDRTLLRYWDGETFTRSARVDDSTEGPSNGQGNHNTASGTLDGAFGADGLGSEKNRGLMPSNDGTVLPSAIPDAERSRDPGRQWILPPNPSVGRIEDGSQKGEIAVGDIGIIKGTRRRIPSAKRHVPAAVVDVAEHPCGLTLAAVSVRGLGHQDFATVRQDSVAFVMSDDRRFIIGAIADGVGQARHSHAGADAACRAAIASTRRFLESGAALAHIPWEQVTDAVRDDIRRRAESAFGTRALDAHYAYEIGTTAEVLVVDTQRRPDGGYDFVRAVLAGDGYGYVLGPRGFRFLGSDKALDGPLRTNKVLPLPSDPGPDFPKRMPGDIRRGEAVLIVTDGLGDDMDEGDTRVAGHIHDALKEPLAPHKLLEAISYVHFQSTDDRTALVVWHGSQDAIS
jgi:hypothetical protein